MTRRLAIGAGALAVTAVLAGCAPSAEQDGDSAADGLADTVT